MKTIAKSNRSQSLIGNRIDTLIRNSQDGQTLGIPTGPDSSYLIAEVISCRIDADLSKSLNSNIKWFRYIDDFYFFCNNLSETELAVSQLTKALNKFELELNPEKTRVSKLPVEYEKKWISEIRLYKFSTLKHKQEKDLVNYFSKHYAYSSEYPEDFVIKYGINRIKNLRFDNHNWRMYQSLLLQSMIAEPSVMKTVLEILLKYQNAGYILRKTDIKNSIYNILEYHCLHNNIYEILWALWIAKSLSIN